MSHDLAPHHQTAAEEIRDHLVTLRGGAPFLSSSDAVLLGQWLEEGRSVTSVLVAIERAAESRRQNRSRLPLTLGQAKRHLDKTLTPAKEAPVRGGLPALVATIREAARDDRHHQALLELAVAIEGLKSDDPEALLRGALSSARAFFQRQWLALTEAERSELLAMAEDDLGDLAGLLDEITLAGAVEERARDLLRQAYPWLQAGTLRHLVHDGAAA